MTTPAEGTRFVPPSFRSPSAVAAETMAQLLMSSGFEEIWRRHYSSRAGYEKLWRPEYKKESDSAAKLAQEFRENAEDLSARPDLVAFAREFIGIEHAALARRPGVVLRSVNFMRDLTPFAKEEPKDDEAANALKEKLALLEDYFASITPVKPKKTIADRAKGAAQAVANIPDKLNDITIAAYLAGQSKDTKILKDTVFGESVKETHEEEFRRDSMKKMLLALEKETAQKPFRPIKNSCEFVKNWAAHFVEEIGEHKLSNGILFAASVGAYKFMTLRLPPPYKSRMTRQETSITNLSLDSLDQDIPITHNPALIRDNIDGQSCHNHIKEWFKAFGFNEENSQAAADFAAKNLPAFVVDCTRLNDYAEKVIGAQSKLQFGYDWFNARMKYIIEDRVTDIAKSMPASTFTVTFIRVAHETAQYIYIFDNIENATFHLGLYFSALIASHKFNALENEEAHEKWNSIKDFFRRAAKTNYIGYGLGIASAGAYTASGLPAPDVLGFWSGIFGFAAGSKIHKLMNADNRAEHVQNVTISAQEILNEFQNVAGEIPHKPNRLETEKEFKKARRKKAGLTVSFATAAAIALATLFPTHSVQASEMAATGAARTAVTGTYLAANVPQDSFLHVIFAAFGGATGLLTGKTAKYGSRGINYFRRRDDDLTPA